MKKIYVPKKETKAVTWQTIALGGLLIFLFSCTVITCFILNRLVHVVVDPQKQQQQQQKDALYPSPHLAHQTSQRNILQQQQQQVDTTSKTTDTSDKSYNNDNNDATFSVQSVLRNLRILVVIVAFDFSQIPHLEEVLDGYHDVCVAGAQQIDVVIHATVAYPVFLIDLWNTRFNCEQFQLSIVLKPKSLRLHLVDEHRKLFYEKIEEYDLFIYTEDDMRVSPTTVATYMFETKQVEKLLQDSTEYKPSDFNVGIVRYEYNYPANVIIDDNTRHATQNVSRVYWEHSGFERPVVPNALLQVPQIPLSERYVAMKNHHQGMFLATRDLLKAWAIRGPNCRFNEVRDRPGKGPQPTQGTQRVWMSSHMLYGSPHCNVQQVIPKNAFGALTILHLPNKNYRRVGKYRNRKFADGSEVFEKPHDSLLTAMELHLGIRRAYPNKPTLPYRGIQMIDEVYVAEDRDAMLEKRLDAFHEYAKRGGVMNEDDMSNTNLVEEG